MPPACMTDDDAFHDECGNQSDRKTSVSVNAFDILSVNQLIESVCIYFFCQLIFSLQCFETNF